MKRRKGLFGRLRAGKKGEGRGEKVKTVGRADPPALTALDQLRRTRKPGVRDREPSGKAVARG